MRFGLMAEGWSAGIDDLAEEATFAAAAGLQTYWLTQIWRLDAMTVIPRLASQAPNLEFATGVVPSYLRHPMALACQALTVSALTGGRFTLGIGLMHRPLIEGMFEMPFDRPVRYMSEYLDVLVPLLDQQPVDASGQTVSYHGTVDVPNAGPCPLMIAALGPQMLRLCGARTSGTITWMTGPRTLREHVVPTVNAAAEAAGRPPPRVAALAAMYVSDDVGRAKARAARILGGYDQMPSYRAMMDREGLAGPQDMAIIGNEESVREQIAAYESAGATDIGILVMGRGEDRDRTRALIAALQ